MNRPPPRTGRTSLTDAQLYLFDALFDVAHRLGGLRREAFATLNLPYSHDLDPLALDAVVGELAHAGLLRMRAATGRPDLGPWVYLTSAGGRLWELEREPEWARFCSDSSRPEGRNGVWVLRIRASDARLAEAFLETAQACGLYWPEWPRLSRRQVTAPVVPWKSRGQLVELRVPLRLGEASRIADWPRYEARRTWWRTIPELATLAA